MYESSTIISLRCYDLFIKSIEDKKKITIYIELYLLTDVVIL